ncbi:hypothetical protein [Pedosphaera parvula]|uniref:Uncharacterized protein n=1 Tax=Pedosphaera parvula (strain Ellin514) TaxID=320771 RepID=B9XMV7_PEDPL|nr:hypothetical protein [Pedosphaera parvula]EEF58882.1 hypothetical protein Cflav_PD1715 [Pedosphaera parvula Ellin514]
MKTFAIILFAVMLWWLFVAILFARYYNQRIKQEAEKPVADIPQPDIPRPRWPTWREVLGRPTLFLIIPYVVSLHAFLFALIWPMFSVHRVYYPKAHKKR